MSDPKRSDLVRTLQHVGLESLRDSEDLGSTLRQKSGYVARGTR